MDAVQIVRALPRPDLRGLVTVYSGYRVSSAPGVHRGLPSRGLTFIVTIDGTVNVTLGDGPRQCLTGLVGGLHSSPALIDHPGYQHGVQVSLTPLGARALLGTPAGELAGTVLDLAAVRGPAGVELTDRMRTAVTWTDRFAVLDDWMARVAAPARIQPELGWVWRRLAATSGRAEVVGLAAEVGWSRQHLSTRFRREFGLTPKVTARVMRFEAAGDLLVATGRPNLAEIAARCGYADQSHLSRDWHAFTGLAPTEWIEQELPFVQDGATVDA